MKNLKIAIFVLLTLSACANRTDNQEPNSGGSVALGVTAPAFEINTIFLAQPTDVTNFTLGTGEFVLEASGDAEVFTRGNPNAYIFPSLNTWGIPPGQSGEGVMEFTDRLPQTVRIRARAVAPPSVDVRAFLIILDENDEVIASELLDRTQFQTYSFSRADGQNVKTIIVLKPENSGVASVGEIRVEF